MPLTPQSNTRSRQYGLSLVELMIGLLLSSLILLATTYVFYETRRSSRMDEQMIFLQENGRFALKTVTHSLAMAGFWGGILDTTGIATTGTSLASDCGATGVNWGLDLTGDSIEFINDASVNDADAYSCINTSNFRPATDIVAVRHVGGTPVTSFNTGGTYIRSNRSAGTLFQDSTEPALPAAPVENWRLRTSLYYIRANSNGNDGVPSLCRRAIGISQKTMELRCLAQGIEQMHLEWGIDSSNDLIVDYFDPDPTAAEMADAIQVQVYLLVRSLEPVTDYVNDKSYRLGSRVEAARNDGFLRKVFTGTVQLSNVEKMRVRAIGT